MKYIISVLSKDKPGIVCDISTAIFNSGGNISDMSQTVIRGYFTLVTYAIFDKDIDKKALIDSINKYGDYQVIIVPFEENALEEVAFEKYVLTVKCNEQKGIISSITSYLYEKNINIENFYAYAKDNYFIIVAEMSVPTDNVALKIKKDIKKLGEKWDLSVHLSHENIYLAMNTICPTSRLSN